MKRLWVLLVVAAAARLVMQMAALPPYAGLDEAYHVARLAFVVAEGRNPRSDEPSIPPYIARSIAAQPGRPAAFGTAGAEWPGIVRQGVLQDRVLTFDDLRPYQAPNYESQHPSLYYTLAAEAAKLLQQRTQLAELRLWRAISVAFALITVIAIASIGMRVAGEHGLLAAALLVAVPTWLTLVVRASNDAFACAAIAVAFAVSFSASASRGKVALEAALWALALAVKLYSWPAAVGVFILWWIQKTPWSRRLAVMVAGACAIGLTLVDLGRRTRNPLGLFMFDPAARAADFDFGAVDWGQIAKVTVASFAWMSGQHTNALRPLAMALYLGPLVVLFGLAVLRNIRPYRGLIVVCVGAAVAFAVAQLANVMAYERVAGGALPAGGKEGWYWYTLAPLWFGMLFPTALRHLSTRLVAAGVVWWLAWDVLITEGALFLDYAGVTSPAAGDALFRWGPRRVPFTIPMDHVSVGPWAEYQGALRGVYLVAVAAMVGLTAMLAASAWHSAARGRTRRR